MDRQPDEGVEVVFRGEDLLQRARSVARRIENRVWRAMGRRPPRPPRQIGEAARPPTPSDPKSRD